MKKIISDLFTDPSDGRYSKKSFIIMGTFLFVLSAGTYILIDKDSSDHAVGIFNTSLIFLSTAIGIATADKKILSKLSPTKGDKQEDI